MGKKAGNRKHSKIDALDPALRETVEQMLLSGSTYSEIVDFLGANGGGHLRCQRLPICQSVSGRGADVEHGSGELPAHDG